MKDFLGNELSVGDKVLVTTYHQSGMVRGTVVQITPKRCRVTFELYEYCPNEEKLLDSFQILLLPNLEVDS